MVKRIKIYALTALLICMYVDTFAQEKKVSLEAIFKENVFSQKSVHGINWMKDGKYYSSLVRDNGKAQVVKMNVATGEQEAVLIDGNKLGIDFSSYSFNADESKALIATEVESIYRRSSKGIFYVVDMSSGVSQELMDGKKISYATLSPDNTRVAFVMDNDLYYITLDDNEVHQITKDGEWNHIINGAADWVYEEEFSMAQAFSWSPDGSKIAFIRFDESQVPEYNMQLWGPLYPQDYKFKYPKAGEKNAEVSIHIHDINANESRLVDAGAEQDIYLPRMYWAGSSNTLAFIRLNRLQNQLDLLYANAATGKSKVILTEKADTYVDLNYNDNLLFLEEGKGFLRTSEQDGYKHIYHHDQDGKLINQVTSGDWEVTEVIGVDQKAKKIYYVSTEQSELNRNLYAVKFNGKGKTLLTPAEGNHGINMSPDHQYFVDYYSTANAPLTVSLKEAKGDLIKVLEDNALLNKKLKGYALSKKEFFDFETVDGTRLNGYMIKPADFDEGKEYPVLMYVYGGPGSENVKNSWGGMRDFWHHHLASEGYIVVCVDNRGTGGRGRDFKHVTYGQLGNLETQDQIAGANYLAALPYIDGSRIGIWGWSYGGYMSSLSLMLGADVFKTAIAVAPVTTWRYYDTIYTERYLQTPQLNASGYDDNSPLSHVDKLEGNFLLIHGTGDDNVHFQNSVALVDALIAADKQFETFYYPNRNHGIYGGNTTWHLYNMMTDFIKRKL
ncbi:peptidase S9 [Echinicola pacifica]|uniref:Peptidase S9 n=1 Tax=Echinicola pacifica TaxID=346377 RepID=A0A918PU01_9BACT|nr:S9 family peptidase [Echinicola pacifica]GGZ22745.1 peptidase S9 [Echinicola pacifica]